MKGMRSLGVYERGIARWELVLFIRRRWEVEVSADFQSDQISDMASITGADC